MTSQPPISPMSRPTPARLRGARAGSTVRTLLAVLALALLLGITQLGAAVEFSEVPWAAVAFTLVFWIWMLAGVIAWWRRPENGIGSLLVIGGIAIYLGGMANVPAPTFQILNSIFATSVLAVTVHILLAFPSGRLRGRLSVSTVMLGYIVTIGFDVLTTLIPADNTAARAAVLAVQSTLGGLFMLVTAGLLLRRLVRADSQHRRVLLPLFLYGIISVLLVPLVPRIAAWLEFPWYVSGTLQLAILACLPLAFLTGMLIGGFKRTTALEALSAWLAVSGSARPAVVQALGATLGDDSLRVFYWTPGRETYIDETGASVERAPHHPDRGWIDVHVDQRRVGAISYDTRLVGDPASVRRAGEVLALAIDRERLTSELLASNQELVRSRLRLVEAADRERSRIARDLHDGLQMQLVLLALEAQTISNSADTSAAASAATAQLRRGIDAAASDLRDLVHNVLPAGLLEQGLNAAAEDLVDRLEMPATLDSDLDANGLSRATAHTAYFVLAELLANAVRHARATRVRITLRQAGTKMLMEVSDDGVGGARMSRGSGLSGLVDRVAAIEGSIEIESVAGSGTQVRVELPCE